MRNTCIWWNIDDDYFESECSNQMEMEDYENISPEFCPYCGGKIEIEE